MPMPTLHSKFSTISVTYPLPHGSRGMWWSSPYGNSFSIVVVLFIYPCQKRETDLLQESMHLAQQPTSRGQLMSVNSIAKNMQFMKINAAEDNSHIRGRLLDDSPPNPAAPRPRFRSISSFMMRSASLIFLGCPNADGFLAPPPSALPFLAAAKTFFV